MPWSSPQSSRTEARPSPIRFTARRASSGLPGAGYRMRWSGSGNPPKSWRVPGRTLPVVKVPATYQWAEIARTAFGRGSSAARSRKPRDQRFSSMAFMGLPCPTKSTGIRPAGVASLTAAPSTRSRSR